MDTTEPLGKSGPTLITAVDDYSRYSMTDCYYGNKATQSAAFLKRLVSDAPFPVNAIRVDNGSEFRGKFIITCRQPGIKIIRNPVKHLTSNGKVERLHRTIEEECFWRVGAKPNDLEYARYWLSRYLTIPKEDMVDTEWKVELLSRGLRTGYLTKTHRFCTRMM